MFFIKLVALYILIYGVLFFSGWGLCESICKGKNEKYKFLLAPLLGIVPLSILPLYFSLVGVNTALGGWITFILCLSWSIYHIARNPSAIKKAGEHSSLLVLFVIISVLPSFIILLKAGYLTSTLQSYSSFVTYPAEYFSHNTWQDKVALDFDRPFTSMLYEIFKYNEMFSWFFFVSAISSIFGLPAFKIYLVLSAIIGAFAPISIYIACKEGFNLNNRSSLLVAFLTAINISYFAWAVIGQLPQIGGIIFLILNLGFLPSMLQCKKKRIDLVFYSFLISGLLVMYGLMLVHFLGIALVFIILRTRSSAELFSTLVNIRTISLITFLIDPRYFIWLAVYIAEYTAVTSQFTTNIPRVAYPEELLGLGPHFSLDHDGSLKSKLMQIIALPLILFSCAGMYISFKRKNILVLSSMAVMLGMAGYFFAGDLTYHLYKHSVIGVFILLLTLVIGGEWILQKTNSRVIRYSVMGAFIACIGINSYNLIHYSFFVSHPLIDRSLMGLQNLVIPKANRVLVDSNNPTEEAWISYFLRDKRIKLIGAVEPWGFWILAPFTGEPNFKFFFDYQKDEIDFTLSKKRPAAADIVNTIYGETIYENDGYVLTKDIPNLLLAKGWHGLERDADGPFRWTQKESHLLFHQPVEDSAIMIKGIVPGVYVEPVEFSIYINETLVDQFSAGPGKINKLYFLDKVSLKKTGNRLAIVLSRTFSPNKLWGSPDIRRLGVQVREIKILPGPRRKTA